MEQQHQQKKINIINFIFASILVHITFFALLLLTSKFETATNKPEIIELTFEDTATEKKKEKSANPTFIVESDSQNANDQLNENAKFLSEKNNSVKKETKAKTGAKFQNAESTAVKSQKEIKASKKQVQSKPKLFDNSFDAYSALNKNEQVNQKFQRGNNSDKTSTTNDNLVKIESDLMTRLNTKEYRYFGYYSRIKKQLNQWWVPKVQQKFTKMLKQGRTIASEDNKITKLVITLNDSGQLVKVQVMAESGIKDLDDAAIEAFRSAAPFPNPPKGMIDDKGQVKIRWDCVVES